jgi:hypothetical protein
MSLHSHRYSASRAPRPAAVLRRLARHAFEAAALTALLLLSTPPRAWAVEPWPELPLPPKADVQWVAQSMRVNGVPTRVLQFQSRASRAEIANYYRSYWTGGYPHKASVHAYADATIVGQMHGPYLMTLKVEDADHGASQGVISVAQVIGSRVDRDPGALPLMNGAHVLQVVESDDPGKHSRQVVVTTPQPPASVRNFYEASFGNAGWQQLQGTDTADVPHRATVPAGAFVAFAREGAEMQLSIVATPRGRGSIVLANLVTKDTGTAEE